MRALRSYYRMGTFKAQEPPCLSLYQPTHRHYPAKQQDPIRFKNLLKMLEQSLRHKYAAAEIQSLLQPFEELGEDRDFWKFTHDGLAVLAAPGFFRYYRLQRIVPEFALVADSFHLKPILRIVQSADYYQILGLNRREIKLYQGNRDIVDEIEPAAGVPRTIVDALGAELTEPHLTVASYGTGASGPAMHHGHGSKADELDIDIERFFRAVDRAVLEHHSRPSRLPLVLAALPEYHGVFRQVSHNPFLVFEYIDSYPGALSPEALRQRVWTVIEPTYLARLLICSSASTAASRTDWLQANRNRLPKLPLAAAWAPCSSKPSAACRAASTDFPAASRPAFWRIRK
jgi:hypothetical protein